MCSLFLRTLGWLSLRCLRRVSCREAAGRLQVPVDERAGLASTMAVMLGLTWRSHEAKARTVGSEELAALVLGLDREAPRSQKSLRDFAEL